MTLTRQVASIVKNSASLSYSTYSSSGHLYKAVATDNKFSQTSSCKTTQPASTLGSQTHCFPLGAANHQSNEFLCPVLTEMCTSCGKKLTCCHGLQNQYKRNMWGYYSWAYSTVFEWHLTDFERKLLMWQLIMVRQLALTSWLMQPLAYFSHHILYSVSILCTMILWKRWLDIWFRLRDLYPSVCCLFAICQHYDYCSHNFWCCQEGKWITKVDNGLVIPKGFCP